MRGVRNRPRFRARLLRELVVKMSHRPQGVTLEDARSEFWVIYDYEPSQVLMSQQAQQLNRDGRIERTGWGHYRGIVFDLPPEFRRDAAPAAHAPTAGSIFD